MSAGFHRGPKELGLTLGDLFGRSLTEGDTVAMRTFDGEDGYPALTVICGFGSKAALVEWLFESLAEATAEAEAAKTEKEKP